MEVAGQWRREWAGTAEYGKVTEGGVTRQVARAMEVLHASAPGARMRVLRAAYHSTAGPGAPTSSYLLHSSRRENIVRKPAHQVLKEYLKSAGLALGQRGGLSLNPLTLWPEPSSGTAWVVMIIHIVGATYKDPIFTGEVISSGYNFIEPETSLSKPLEISSTPLESSPEVEVSNESYKVTEPDDFEISEPSKWRGSKSINSIRMPSEESSSTDNASIIDLDYNNKNTIRNHTEKFTPQTYHKRVSPISSLLDTPVTLSTLKYKSLLNGNESWNNRRKSYSFEDTPELDESVLRETDALTMESSTDSGICKSSEIVNSENYNIDSNRYVERKSKMDDIHEETFKDWLSKNRKKHSINRVQNNKQHIIGIRLEDENNIILQSAGKVSITLPTSTKTDGYYETKTSHVTDDYDKKTKKVEFCKTELHFAAETGTVNIIATDEKPPPSNDFRKKRSMFVPMTDSYNKSITLFGEKSDVFKINKKDNSGLTNDTNTIDENTAATKGILKNKIPKPKPYLLGENMSLGDSINLDSVTVKDDTFNNYSRPTGVSLINQQLQIDRKFSNESRSSIENESDWCSFKKHSTRTNKIGPEDYTKSSQEIEPKLLRNQIEKDVSDTIKSKVKLLQMSPTPTRAKTRQLRESDLTYFGVSKSGSTQNEKRKHSLDSIYDENNHRDEILHSVQLVKLISNSVCNSEIDSDEAPDYENVPVKNNFSPKPVPRSRSRYHNYLNENKEHKDLNPILEKDDETVMVAPRRVKVKRHPETSTNRSLSEPPKANRQKSKEMHHRLPNKTNQINKSSSLSKNNGDTLEKGQKAKKSEIKVPERRISESPIYVNLGTKDTRKPVNNNDLNRMKQRSIPRQKVESTNITTKDNSSYTKHTKSKTKCKVDNVNNATKQRMHSEKQKKEELDSDRKKGSPCRTKVLVTPEKSPSKESREVSSNKYKNEEKNSFKEKKLTNNSTQKHDASKIELIGRRRIEQDSNDLHTDRESKKLKAPLSQKNVKAVSTPKKYRKSSTDNTSIQNSLKEQQDAHTKTLVADITIPQLKANKAEKIDKTENKSRRSKYVINYDDKNGTVSSICKIKPDHGSIKKKINVNYDNSFKNHTVNMHNSPNKSNLLQLPDQQRNLYGNSKTKSKFRARQSCQIL